MRLLFIGKAHSEDTIIGKALVRMLYIGKVHSEVAFHRESAQ